jgi:serine/threonine protein kinase
MAHHIVYRDLKPSNVLMSVDGHICITDFGLCAQLRAEKDWQSTGNVGTVGYQAPEVVQRRPYGFGVDFFSLGVTIFRIITGKRPYGKQGNYNMPVDYSYFSKDLTSLLKGLLDLDPDKRLGYRLGGHSAEYLATQLPHQRKSNSQKSISVAGRDPPPRVRWADVKNHAFFSDIDWKAIANKVVEPPLKPRKQQVDKSPKHASFAETEMKKFNQFACNFPRSNSLRHDSRNRTGKKSNKYPALPLSKDQHKLFDGFEYNVRLNPNDLTLLENNLAMQQGGHSQRKSRHPQSENNSRNAPGEPQLTSVLPLAIFKTGPGDDPFRRRDNTKTQQTAKRSSSQLGHDAPKWTLKKEASISLRSSQLEESR